MQVGNYSSEHLSLLLVKVAHEYRKLGRCAEAAIAEQHAKDLKDCRSEPRAIPPGIARELHRERQVG